MDAVTTKVSKADILWYNFLLLPRSARIYAPVAFCLVFAFYAQGLDLTFPEGYLEIFFESVEVTVALIIAEYVFASAILLFSLRRRGDYPRTFELRPDGIGETGLEHDTLNRWSNVRFILRKPRVILVGTDTGGTIAIPRRGFSNGQEFDAFYRTAQTFWSAKKDLPPTRENTLQSNGRTSANSVSVEIGRRDLFVYQWYHLTRRRINLLCTSILFIWCLALFIYDQRDYTPRGIAIAVFAAAAGALIALIIGFTFSVSSYLASRRLGDGVLGRHHFELDSEGVSELTAANTSHYRWSSILYMHKARKFIVFGLDEMRGLMLPRRAFRNDDEFHSFYEEAHALWQAAAPKSP